MKFIGELAQDRMTPNGSICKMAHAFNTLAGSALQFLLNETSPLSK